MVAPVAYISVDMAARLSVYSYGRQPLLRKALLCQPVQYDVARWSVARSIVDVYHLGCLERYPSGRTQSPAQGVSRSSRCKTRSVVAACGQYIPYIQSDGCRIHVLPCALNGACRADGRTDIHKFPCVGGSTAHRGIPCCNAPDACRLSDAFCTAPLVGYSPRPLYCS